MIIVLKRLTIYLHRQSKHNNVGKSARKNAKCPLSINRQYRNSASHGYFKGSSIGDQFKKNLSTRVYTNYIFFRIKKILQGVIKKILQRIKSISAD